MKKKETQPKKMHLKEQNGATNSLITSYFGPMNPKESLRFLSTERKAELQIETDSLACKEKNLCTSTNISMESLQALFTSPEQTNDPSLQFYHQYIDRQTKLNELLKIQASQFYPGENVLEVEDLRLQQQKNIHIEKKYLVMGQLVCSQVQTTTSSSCCWYLVGNFEDYKSLRKIHPNLMGDSISSAVKLSFDPSQLFELHHHILVDGICVLIFGEINSDSLQDQK